MCHPVAGAFIGPLHPDIVVSNDWIEKIESPSPTQAAQSGGDVRLRMETSWRFWLVSGERGQCAVENEDKSTWKQQQSVGLHLNVLRNQAFICLFAMKETSVFILIVSHNNKYHSLYLNIEEKKAKRITDKAKKLGE